MVSQDKNTNTEEYYFNALYNEESGFTNKNVHNDQWPK